MRHFDSFQRFTQRTDLVHLHQDRICDMLFNAALQALGVGYKQIITDKLMCLADQISYLLPAIPIIFAQAILN